jgi:hypothetical protein
LNTPTPADWRRDARHLLRNQLASKDMGYKELSRALEALGIEESPKALSNKINRGTFSVVFLLQCLRALDIDTVKFKD